MGMAHCDGFYEFNSYDFEELLATLVCDNAAIKPPFQSVSV